MPAIDKALEHLGARGVISNGAPLKKDRVFQLQPELSESPGGDSRGSEPTQVPPISRSEEAQE
jgi:hypothetical protein